MKKILVLLISLMMCGCTAVYNLEIRDNDFYENIEVSYLKSENKIGTELYEQISNLKNDAIPPFKDNASGEKYDVIFNDGDNKSKVNLKYKFNQTAFLQSNLFNTCFENNDSIFNDQYYVISVNGNFICNYFGNFKVKIKTNHKVIKNNADEVIGNHTYIWNIKYNEESNIYIKMYKSKKNINWPLTIGVIFVVGSLLIFMIKIAKKMKYKDKV